MGSTPPAATGRGRSAAGLFNLISVNIFTCLQIFLQGRPRVRGDDPGEPGGARDLGQPAADAADRDAGQVQQVHGIWYIVHGTLYMVRGT